MKKKIVGLFLLVVIILGVTACGNYGGSSPFSKGLNAKDLSIEDFKWETKSNKCGGSDCYVLSLTNNSKFDIIGVNFTYKVKDSVDDYELSVYEDFMQGHEEDIEEDDSPRDVTLIGSKNELVKKGSELTDLRFTVGFQDNAWYDYPTDEQFELMEPKELQLGIVRDNKLYIAYYDFQKKSWKLDEKTIVADTWSNKDIAKKLSKPNGAHYVVITDEADKFEIYSYGVTENMYNEYIETLKSSGFVEDFFYEASVFVGADSNRNTVIVQHYNEEQRLEVLIEKYTK